MFKSLKRDIDAVFGRDPAVRSRLEVILCYPGFHAIMLYRLAHAAWRRDWLLLGRFLSHVGRLLTGIEIHPGARIGRGLFIDHGLGVVIGETAELGENVTLYHDVTLAFRRIKTLALRPIKNAIPPLRIMSSWVQGPKFLAPLRLAGVPELVPTLLSLRMFLKG